jgi:hypothetical protein
MLRRVNLSRPFDAACPPYADQVFQGMPVYLVHTQLSSIPAAGGTAGAMANAELLPVQFGSVSWANWR